MEDLNKTQTVLLCLLVSFVTSIGTGIITVSLLQEAPQSVTQTINRVVERTVEKVVPQTTGGSVKTKEVTVVVKEEDLVIDAINKNSKSIARIVQNGPGAENTFLGIGLVISADGTITADKKNFVLGSSYTATFFDGKSFPVKISTAGEKNDAVFLTVIKDEKPYTFYPAIISDSDSLQLGQTIIALGGKTNNVVSIGRINGLVGEPSNPAVSTSTKAVTLIETDAPPKENVSGTLLINLNGEIVGLYLPNPNENSGKYVAIQVVKRGNPSFFELPKKNSP
jgi:PKD repeat protein